MKKIFIVSFVVIILAALFVMPVFALGAHQVDNPATDVQMYLIGAASLAIIYVIKLITTRFPKIQLTRAWISVLIYIVALILSLSFGGFVFPVFPGYTDPLTFVSDCFGFINALLLAMAPPVSLATLFYNLILKRVLDAIAVKADLIEQPKAEPLMVAKK